jgi:hypothetical protein
VTISDLELEAGLRDLRGRTDHLAPPPADLAQRTRERYRAQRRTRTAMAAGGLLLLLVFVGLPVAASTFAADPQRGQTATPSRHTFEPSAPTGLYAHLTRGDLADDDEWVDAVAALDWGPVDPSTQPAGLQLPDPPVDSRRVAFAGNTSSGRVALVLGLDGRYVAYAWFVGPEDAEPDEMALAITPGHVGPDDFLGLVDAAGPTAEEQSLIVVAMPGDTITWGAPSVVSASGEVDDQTIELDVDEGIGMADISVPWSWDVDVRANGQRRGGSLADSDRSRGGPPTPGIPADVAIADPRGLAGATQHDVAASIAGSVLDEYAVGAADARPTLLAAGALGARTGQYGELYGMTHPSGATEIWLVTYLPSRAESGSQIFRFPPSPVGQPLMDRVIAVSAMAGLLVSASDGAEAQVLDPSGAVLTTIALTRGAGSGPMNDPLASKVRILDAAGNVVGEGPVTRIGP